MILKAGIHNMTLAQIFALICNLDESTIVDETLHHSADFGLLELTEFTENGIVYDGYRCLQIFSFRL